MAKFNYFLRDRNAEGPTPIVLFIAFNNTYVKIRTGEAIVPKYWDFTKQLAKPAYTGSSDLNAYLANYMAKARAAFRGFGIKQQIPTSEELRKEIELPKPEPKSAFKTAYEEFQKANKEKLQPNTIKKYNTLLAHLTAYEEKVRKTLTFNSIDLSFYDSFTTYLTTDKTLNNTSVSKYIKALKSFMAWAQDRGLHQTQHFRKFKTPEYKSDIIYLTEKELRKLSKLALKKDPKLIKVRDTFCFGCYTGLRFSDIANLTWKDVRNNSLQLHIKKTKEILEVPLNKHALAILKKYEGTANPLPSISNPKMNEYLKELGKAAKFKEEIKLTRYSGSKRTESYVPKYNLITTHTARRTFVTLSLEKGMRPETLMEITGHKDFKTLKKYIKITSNVKQTEMNKIWK